MLSHRNQAFTPEALMDQLWVGEDYADPRGTLRRQMHRLRQLLEVSEEDTFVVFQNGYYRWNAQKTASVDADAFEALHAEGNALSASDPEMALERYLSALDLYQGEFLPPLTNEHWIFAPRKHYQRLYTKTVLNAVSLLKAKFNFDRIIDLCTFAIKIDIYEEAFHLMLMEALLEKGEKKQALAHYEYITGFYYAEMGLAPSPEMRLLYKRLIRTESPIRSKQGILDALEPETDYENAFFCEPNVFKSIYELERRRSQRSGDVFSVGVLTIQSTSKYTASQETLRMNHLKQHLMSSLRKGDTFTLWTPSQVMLLLPKTDAHLMVQVLKRVLASFPDSDAFEIDYVDCLTAEPIPEHFSRRDSL